MRARRRADERRLKARALRVLRSWAGRRAYTPDPREVGVCASTHCRPCGCWMCQADAREVPPKRERPFDHPESE